MGYHIHYMLVARSYAPLLPSSRLWKLAHLFSHSVSHSRNRGDFHRLPQSGPRASQQRTARERDSRAPVCIELRSSSIFTEDTAFVGWEIHTAYPFSLRTLQLQTSLTRPLKTFHFVMPRTFSSQCVRSVATATFLRTTSMATATATTTRTIGRDEATAFSHRARQTRQVT